MILFLDDDHARAAITYQRWSPERVAHTIWCQTAQEAIATLRDYELEEVHLDHDLGGTHFQDSRAENSGMEVVRWLERHAEGDPKWEKTVFTVHSHNPPAAQQMVLRLRDLGFNVKYVPFGLGREVLV